MQSTKLTTLAQETITKLQTEIDGKNNEDVLKKILSDSFAKTKPQKERSALHKQLQSCFHSDKTGSKDNISAFINAAYQNEKTKLPGLIKLEGLVATSPYHRWAYTRFFLNNDKEIFKSFCTEPQYLLSKIPGFTKIYEEVNELTGHIDEIDDSAHIPQHIQIIQLSIDIAYEILQRGSSTSADTDDISDIYTKLLECITNYTKERKDLQDKKQEIESKLETMEEQQKAMHMQTISDISNIQLIISQLIEATEILSRSAADKQAQDIATKINNKLDQENNERESTAQNLLTQDIEEYTSTKNKLGQEIRSLSEKILYLYANNSAEFINEEDKQQILGEIYSQEQELIGKNEDISKLTLTITVINKLLQVVASAHENKISEASIQKVSKHFMQTLKLKLEDLQKKIESDTINIGATVILFLLYLIALTTFATSIQATLFGAVLLGGSFLTNIAFGVIASIIATPIAITVSKLRHNTESNKPFNLVLVCIIFAACAYIAPSIELLLLGKVIYSTILAYKFIFALAATAITYTALNIVELIIKRSISNANFILLSILKDTVRDIAITMLLAVTAEPLLMIFKAYERLGKMALQKSINIFKIRFIEDIIASQVLNIIYTVALIYAISILLAPAIGISILNYIVSAILCDLISIIISTAIMNSPTKNLPLAYTRFINFTARQITNLCNFTEACLNHSLPIFSWIESIFSKYRQNIPTIQNSDSSTSIVKPILQVAIDMVLLPIFALAYPPYKVAEMIFTNTKKIVKAAPITTTVFFIAVSALSTIFASPIQLVILGHLVMAASPVMSIMFGTMLGLASTLFMTNACAYITTCAPQTSKNAFNNPNSSNCTTASPAATPKHTVQQVEHTEDNHEYELAKID